MKQININKIFNQNNLQWKKKKKKKKEKKKV